jgi:hypothetical protein
MGSFFFKIIGRWLIFLNSRSGCFWGAIFMFNNGVRGRLFGLKNALRFNNIGPCFVTFSRTDWRTRAGFGGFSVTDAVTVRVSVTVIAKTRENAVHRLHHF